MNSNSISRLLLLGFACCISFKLEAQEIEPRIYANVPKGMNALGVLYGISRGNVISEPTLPLQDFKITSHNIGLAYVRTFAIGTKLSRIQVSLPFAFMSGSLKINGRDTSGARTGFGDTRIRLSMNLIGSPALAAKDFRRFQQNTIVGVSIVVSAPTGLYYDDKRINIGTNRWGFKPEIGISKRFKHVYAEAYSGVWFYTNNNEFLVNKHQEQKPVFSIQGHACYYFKNMMWLGFNGNWFNGGETTVDNTPMGDLKDNWRIGVTWSVPINRAHSLKLMLNTGAFTTSGLDYNQVVLGYQYVFF